MKKLLLILFLFTGLFSAHAQQYFNKRYPMHSSAVTLSSIVPLNGKYYCVGEADDSTDTTYSVTGIKFAILDSVGNLISDTIYQRPGIRNYSTIDNHTLTPLPDKGFILGVAQDVDETNGVLYALLVRYDSIGNILWTREYNKPFCVDTYTYYTIADLQPTGTGEWLMLTTIQCTVDPTLPTYFVLTKLDSNFNEEWNKEYGYYLLRNPAGKLFVEADGYILGGAVSNEYYVDMTGIKWQASMIKTDTAGNVQWQWKSDSTKETFTIQDVLHTRDGGYIYCGAGAGYTEHATAYIDEIEWKGWIEKLDSNRNVVWFDTLDRGYSTIPILFVKLIELPDSSVVVGGTLEGGFGDDMTPYFHDFAFLSRYRPDGQIVSQRKYSFFNDTVALNVEDVKRTPDNGFVLCGYGNDPFLYYGSTGQQAWVLKVDSNGCMGPTDPQCLTEGVPGVAQGVAVSVYPNPVGSTLTFATDYLPAREELTITDLLGQTILTERITTLKQQIDVRAWPPGVYIYYLSSAGSPVVTGKVVKY